MEGFYVSRDASGLLCSRLEALFIQASKNEITEDFLVYTSNKVIGGRRNIIPGTIMFTIFGYLGQTIFNILDARHTQQMYQAATEDRDNTSFWRRMANSKYSPMKVLSNEEYEKILQKKLLRVEAEIAVIDDDIEKLKASSSRGKLARSERNGSVTQG